MEGILTNGLIVGHAYSVTDVLAVSSPIRFYLLLLQLHKYTVIVFCV